MNIPTWLKEFRTQLKINKSNVFLFDGNIYDEFVWVKEKFGFKNSPYPFLEYLIREIISFSNPSNDFIVTYYSPTILFKVLRQEDILNHLEVLPIPSKGERMTLKSNPEHFLSNQLTKDDKPIELHKIPNQIARIEKIIRNSFFSGGNSNYRIFCIIDNIDKFLSESPSVVEKVIVEMIQRWAIDPHVNFIKNKIILLAENKEDLPKSLINDYSGVYHIRVDFPDRNYRKFLLELLKNSNLFNNFKRKKIDESLLISFLKKNPENLLKTLQHTRGFKTSDILLIDEILRKIKFETGSDNSIITKFYFNKNKLEDTDVENFIKKRKKAVIESSSKGMLVPVETKIKFEHIGGLQEAKKYFKKVSKAIINEDEDGALETIPKGILLAGPPGTGKTLIAKALAFETGLTLVQMGNIRSKWVGESEKNLDIVLSLLKAMAPVIVFIDEIDQAIGQRSTSSGDSGVSSRIFGKILEFMGSNENRGKIIWIAATNRADLLDDAMIRRFDRIIPILLPGSKEEWLLVIKGIFKQINQTNITLKDETIKQFVNQSIDHLRAQYSGSSIEIVLRRVYENALDYKLNEIKLQNLNEAFINFKSNFNYDMYMLQTLISIAACNDILFIPNPDKDKDYSYGEPDIDNAILKVLKTKSNIPIQEIIDRFKVRLRSNV